MDEVSEHRRQTYIVACRRYGIRSVRQTLVFGVSQDGVGKYRTTLTMPDGVIVVAESAGLEPSFEAAVRMLQDLRSAP